MATDWKALSSAGIERVTSTGCSTTRTTSMVRAPVAWGGDACAAEAGWRLHAAAASAAAVTPSRTDRVVWATALIRMSFLWRAVRALRIVGIQRGRGHGCLLLDERI